MKTVEVEIWVTVDEDGTHAVATSREDVDTSDLTGCTRLVRVKLVVPLPCVPTLTGVVPAEGDAALAVA